MTPISQELPAFYYDLQSLAPLKLAAKEDPENIETLRKVAQQFESMFMQMVLKSMRTASLGDSLFDNKQSLFYRDMFDQQLSVKLSGSGGMGLADVLVEQLTRSSLHSRVDPFSGGQADGYQGLQLETPQAERQAGDYRGLPLETPQAERQAGGYRGLPLETPQTGRQVGAYRGLPLENWRVGAGVSPAVVSAATVQPKYADTQQPPGGTDVPGPGNFPPGPGESVQVKNLLATEQGHGESVQVKNLLATEQGHGESVQVKNLLATEQGVWDSPAEFVRAIWPHAVDAAEQLGVDPKVLVAQSALETGWGSKLPHSADGRSSFNLFGIKAGDDWDGQRAVVNSLEYEGDRVVSRKSAFRVYDSVAHAMTDYVDFLKGRARYADALNNAADPEKYSRALQRAGYATDPVYADKILRVMKSAPLADGLVGLANANGEPVG